MTTMSTKTLASSQNDLMHKLAEVLANHPAGSCFRLLFAPEDLEVGEDEVIVQVVNVERGVIELHPRKLDDLDLTEVIHATQVLDPSDDGVNRYADRGQVPQAAESAWRDGAHLRLI